MVYMDDEYFTTFVRARTLRKIISWLITHSSNVSEVRFLFLPHLLHQVSSVPPSQP
eukprot:m.471486 g.471486  ORF g.471486 m.471486 type:complete len:56 (+) comp31110_c0_seq1:1032-1199(+)